MSACFFGLNTALLFYNIVAANPPRIARPSSLTVFVLVSSVVSLHIPVFHSVQFIVFCTQLVPAICPACPFYLSVCQSVCSFLSTRLVCQPQSKLLTCHPHCTVSPGLQPEPRTCLLHVASSCTLHPSKSLACSAQFPAHLPTPSLTSPLYLPVLCCFQLSSPPQASQARSTCLFCANSSSPPHPKPLKPTLPACSALFLALLPTPSLTSPLYLPFLCCFQHCSPAWTSHQPTLHDCSALFQAQLPSLNFPPARSTCVFCAISSSPPYPEPLKPALPACSVPIPAMLPCLNLSPAHSTCLIDAVSSSLPHSKPHKPTLPSCSALFPVQLPSLNLSPAHSTCLFCAVSSTPPQPEPLTSPLYLSDLHCF